jgi:hypothetical protein
VEAAAAPAAPAAAEPTSEPPAPPSKAKPAPKPRPKPAASADGAQIKIGQTITGSLTGSASRTYRFNAKAGSKVRLELTGANPLAYMTLSQPDGKAMIPEETRGLLLELPSGLCRHRHGSPRHNAGRRLRKNAYLTASTRSR